jgi:hypothetical protein
MGVEYEQARPGRPPSFLFSTLLFCGAIKLKSENSQSQVSESEEAVEMEVSRPSI